MARVGVAMGAIGAIGAMTRPGIGMLADAQAVRVTAEAATRSIRIMGRVPDV
jgi:hypothetical protein